MRRATNEMDQHNIVVCLRRAGLDVGTNYPPLTGNNEWGNTVLNFFCEPGAEKAEIQVACDIVKDVVGG